MEALTLIFGHQTQGSLTRNAKVEDILRSKEAIYGPGKSRIDVVKSLRQPDSVILAEKRRRVGRARMSEGRKGARKP